MYSALHSYYNWRIKIRKINYLNNKDLLSEIHKSKCSYSSFSQPEYHQYDIIVSNLNDITTDIITEAQQARAKRLSQKNLEIAKESNPNCKLSDVECNASDIPKTDLIFRVMSGDHIPLDPTRKRTAKTGESRIHKLNFPAFQHWKFDESGQIICVGKSHWKGDVITGSFSKDHGCITSTLARMFIKLCERYATRGNVQGYSYNDEMRGQALLQLSIAGLQFDESKGDNPFAYFTAAVTNSFIRVINAEKKMQNIRDDLLEINGMAPSNTRTINNEHEHALKREADYRE